MKNKHFTKLIGAVIGIALLASCGGSLYTPGMVKEKINLDVPSQTGVSEGYWLVEDDIELFHFEEGTGKPVLVLHGGPGIPFNTPKTTLTALSDNYTFYYYHQRGSGKSSRPIDTFDSQNFYENMITLESTLGLGANIADIERIRKILKQDKLIIIGHSYGGFIATLYAAEFPENVEKLILASPANMLKMPNTGKGLYDYIDENLPEGPVAEEFQEYMKELFDFGTLFSKTEKGLSALHEKLGYFWNEANKKGAPHLPEIEVEENSIAGWPFYAFAFSTGQECDFTGALKNITMPVLILHGDKDLIDASSIGAYRDKIPQSEFHLIPEAGHFILDENPTEVAKIIGGFLAK